MSRGGNSEVSMANHLTSHQEEVYLFIKDYISRNKFAPYIREIQEFCNIQSHKLVIDRLNSLERKGYIKRRINQHRSIKLVNRVSLNCDSFSVDLSHKKDRKVVLDENANT
jgi:SOS-response transcriptional repressor LexA